MLITAWENSLDEQYQLVYWQGGGTLDVLNSVSEKNRSFGFNTWELGDQYDQELADLRYEF